MISPHADKPVIQQQLEGVQLYGDREQFLQHPEGPSPRFTIPDRHALIEARAVLRDGGGASGARISEATQVVLQDTVAMAREFLMASERDKGRSIDQSTWGTAREVEGACELAMYPVYFRLLDNGVAVTNIQQGQSKDIQEGHSVRHAFTVVAMPDGDEYLIDPTLRQFFRPDAESEHSNDPDAPRSGDRIGDPGRYMREHPDPLQRQLAWELLRDGYVALKDGFAEVYLRALRRELDAADTVFSTPTMKAIVRPNSSVARGQMVLEDDDGRPLVPGLPESS